jgi:hypothetical protein
MFYQQSQITYVLLAHGIQLNNSDGVEINEQDLCVLTQEALHILSIFFILYYGVSSFTPFACGSAHHLIYSS